jgi:hypothetical protein
MSGKHLLADTDLDDCLAEISSVFYPLVSLIPWPVAGKKVDIDIFESGYGGMIEILGCFG